MFLLFFYLETKEKVSKVSFNCRDGFLFSRCEGFSLNRRWALTLRSRSSREGFSFLLHEQKKRNKENSPSALFGLLRHFSPLNKKNSLRSNSILFLTLRKAPPLHAQKVRPDLYPFYATSLRSLGWMFLALLVDVNASCLTWYFLICHSERNDFTLCHPERNGVERRISSSSTHGIRGI